MDNPIRPTRTGGLEALMGGLHDTLLACMIEQRVENKKNDVPVLEPRPSLRIRKPNEALGFIYEEIPKFDVQLAREYGYVDPICYNYLLR